MCHFVDGLKQFREMGAPKLHTPIMTYDDVQFAQKMNKPELMEITGESTDDDDGSDFSPLENDDGKVAVGKEILSQSFDEFKLSCSYCGTFVDKIDDIKEDLEDLVETFSGGSGSFQAVHSVYHSFEDGDDKLRELKTIVKMQELGISLEYRCTRCRSCSDCRNGPVTERISAREEAEDQAIKDSIKIDFDNKRIECKLPLRGNPDDFLSNNRETALKVLNAQCKKLKSDNEAKEIILKSFQKLFDGGYAKKFEDLDEEHKKMIESKGVQHYLPWRCVYKDSISTPCRCVMDASSKTPLLPNGKGGRCLNDICMKGRVNTLDLLTMLLRFSVGPAAVAGDLKQFYPSINLHPSQWNLQRVLWRDNLDLDAAIIELIIIVLIYGVRSVSALSENAVIMLANHVKETNPLLAAFLIISRFVDDLADSGENVAKMEVLTKSADELFESVGWKCKGWTVSSKPPHPDCTKDGVSIDVGGMIWYPIIDCIEVKIPPLHFGRKKRGKLVVGTEIFDGSFADLKVFCAKRFTRRTVVSKFYSVFDPFGLLTPITASMKLDVSSAVKETSGWDDEVPLELHDKVVTNLCRLHKLRGIKFTRAKVPIDAVDLKMVLYGTVDAADKLKIVAVYARFKRRNGRWSCQLLIGRSLLSKSGTLPMEELEALMIGSNLLWICRRALESWLSDYFLFGDSVISICWVCSEKKRLSIFQESLQPNKNEYSFG